MRERRGEGERKRGKQKDDNARKAERKEIDIRKTKKT